MHCIHLILDNLKLTVPLNSTMLSIKTSFQINDDFLHHLQALIGMHVTDILSYWPNKMTTEKMAEIFIVELLGKDSQKQLKIKPIFFYNETIGDDVENLQLQIMEKNQEQYFFHDKVNLPHPDFRLKRIQIFGPERFRKWDDSKIWSYFGKSINESIGDYYFSNSIISFISNREERINISISRKWVELNFDTTLKLENDFYLLEELDLNFDGDSDSIWSKVPRVKCHYDIDEKAILKNR